VTKKESYLTLTPGQIVWHDDPRPLPQSARREQRPGDHGLRAEPQRATIKKDKEVSISFQTVEIVLCFFNVSRIADTMQSGNKRSFPERIYFIDEECG